jgi:hypothetical protein
MHCPNCGALDNFKVLETRHHRITSGTRRRRQCLECKHRFPTIEVDPTMHEIIPLTIDRKLAIAAKRLLEEHIKVEEMFQSVTEDQDFFDLPDGLTRTYQEAEFAFLQVAREAEQGAFSLSFQGRQWAIACCVDFEDLQIDECIFLGEVA